MPIFDNETWGKLKSVLDGIKNDVNVLFFTQDFECRSCADTREFIQEFPKLNNKIKVKEYIFDKDKDEAKKYNIDKIPALVLLDSNMKDKGIKFYGVPAGYEINSFIMSLLEVSGREEKLDPDLEEKIKKIDKKVHIQVFISLSCPYCPSAVMTAHKLALKNKNITADMVDITLFPHLANKYNVNGVPKIVINERYDLVGAQPIERFLDVIDVM